MTLWILQGLLALAFLMAGLMKLGKSHEALRADPRMGWVNDFSPGFVKFLGAAELSGALGMVLPPALGIFEMLTPLAALGLLILMVGAVRQHKKRGESSAVVPNFILGGMAAAVAAMWWL